MRNACLFILTASLLWLPFFSPARDSLSHANEQDSLNANVEIGISIASQEVGIGSMTFEVDFPKIILSHVAHEVKFKPTEGLLIPEGKEVEFIINGKPEKVIFKKNVGIYNAVLGNLDTFSVASPAFSTKINAIPLWLSIIPPLIAIFMALFFREVITSLVIGIFVGAAIIGAYTDGLGGIFSGLLSVLDNYVLNAILERNIESGEASTGHISVIVFSLMIGAMVAIISRNGGMLGVVNKISRYARDAKTGQLATWFLGVAIFFDDYANTLIVGNAMRPVTDKLRISREKLSYLVDSTAAPVAAIAFVTTWIGAELGYIGNGIEGLGLKAIDSPYNIFLNSLQYSFYPFLTLIFMLILIFRNRDFGPMLKAENRARSTGRVFEIKAENNLDREKKQELDDLEPIGNSKPRWFNAVIPVIVVVAGTIIGLFYTGMAASTDSGLASMGFAQKISTIIGNSDSYAALLWSSLSGVLVAMLLTLGQRIMSLEQTVDAALSGFKTMLGAMIILILAWALARVTDDMHTADFITGGLEKGGIPPWLLPAITFLLAGLVAFSTGSSWGTMAILYPLMIPAAWKVSQESGLDYEGSMAILYNVVSCILAGSVLGDHCSPISDTTILSSLASNCNHIDHVRTQLPYALTVGSVGILFGTIPSALGLPFWINMPLCIGILFGIIQVFGKKVLSPPES